MKFKIQYSTGGSLEPTPTEIQFDNDSLREAVKEWLNNENDAIEKYGHISNWDVSQVTNMRKLFINAEYFEYNKSDTLLISQGDVVLNDTKNEILNIFSKFIFSKLKKKQYKIIIIK